MSCHKQSSSVNISGLSSTKKMLLLCLGYLCSGRRVLDNRISTHDEKHKALHEYLGSQFIRNKGTLKQFRKLLSAHILIR